MTRILVAYETWSGSTRQVAEAIGQAMGSGGTAIDVRRAREVDDVSPYTGVVAGASVHGGLIVEEACTFVREHHQALARVPVAYFVTCLTMMGNNPQTRRLAGTFIDQLRRQAPGVEPVAVRAFAGGILTRSEEYTQLPFHLKLIMRGLRLVGDHRDWDAIRHWAEELRPLLVLDDDSRE